MCGIVGATAERDVVPILLEGLKRLEYRGYDSAGLIVINDQHELQRRRIMGKVQGLVDSIEKQPIHGTVGIAHTRWATHGVPSENNAHPHSSNDAISLVHNGIIENFEELREQLLKAGYVFSSQTDSEVVVHLLHYYYQEQKDFLQAIRKLAKVLVGAYALAIICKDFPDQVWAIRQGSPLVIGLGIHENFLASDQLALLPVTHRFIYLQEGDIACLTKKQVQIWNAQGEVVQRSECESTLTSDAASKGQYRHFMLKEIFEQPHVIQNLIEKTYAGKQLQAQPFGQGVQGLLEQAKQILIIACGTSYHAGLVAKYWFESIAGIPCHVEIASEFRYRSPVVAPGCLFVSISQSGETADTLAALKLAKEMNFVGYLAICNVPESSLARESDATIMTYAGPEIGVASTKAFTTQLLVLLLAVLSVARHHGKNIDEYGQAILHLPTFISEVLKLDSALTHFAHQFIHVAHTLFLGRGVNFPIAAEGALKLKELSYIHAEAYPAGELKHGPLALVDHDMPILLLAPKNKLLDKIYSNAQEVKTREGNLYTITDDPSLFSKLGEVIMMPTVPECLEPIVYTIPLQLFAYHVAVLKGTDVDQPRNLAKSVTVE